MSQMLDTLYAHAATVYLNAGWRGVLPLPPGEKTPPPDGHTGWQGAWPTEAKIQEWQRTRAIGNIALRLPGWVIGIDVDMYKDPTARERLHAFLGCELPPTWWSSSRDDGSGIFFYRCPVLPAGERWATVPVPCVEVIQFSHRYAVVWPSINPSTLLRYEWHDDSDEIANRVPTIDDLTELPWPAVTALAQKVDDSAEREAIAVAFHEGDMDPIVEAKRNDGLHACRGRAGSRHDGVRDVIAGLMRLTERGYAGVERALAEMRDAFVSAVAGDRDTDPSVGAKKAEKEFMDLIRGAMKLVATTTPKVPSKAEIEGLDATFNKLMSDADTPPVPHANGTTPDSPIRRVKLTPASDMNARPVRWLWNDRIPRDCLTLLGGREGIGKSTLAYEMAAQVTTGRLDGCYEGEPKAVIVVATEDSWEHTIVPRLMAHGADLAKVYRADVVTADGVLTGLVLPKDILELELSVADVDAGLILLDPLLSRLDARLDTHKDAEVRIALEPVVALADRAKVSVVGLIHVNKSQSADPLTMLMGSRAFVAVARAVMFVMKDPDDTGIRLLGQPKNNLGRTDELPTLTFRIDQVHVTDTPEGAVFTGKINWVGETDRTLEDALEAAGEGSDTRTATSEAADWLKDYLNSKGGTCASAEVKKAGTRAGHSERTLKRALSKIQGMSEATGFPRQTFWTLLPHPAASRARGASVAQQAQQGLTSQYQQTRESPLGPTDGPTGGVGPTVEPSRASRASQAMPPREVASLDDEPYEGIF